jgi:hypothetical protein
MRLMPNCSERTRSEGILSPGTAGRVSFDGVDLARANAGTLRRLRRRMQLVFQDPYSSLDPRRRVGDQIADGLSIHRLAPRRERAGRVAALLARVGLTVEHAERYPTPSPAASASASASPGRSRPSRISSSPTSPSPPSTCPSRRRCWSFSPS